MMKLATTPEEQKRWMEQWKNAQAALLEQKKTELRNLTPEQALANADMLLQTPPSPWRNPELETYSGLVEQQRIFRRWHAKK